MNKPLPRFFESLLERSFYRSGVALLSGIALLGFFTPDLLAATPPGSEPAAGDTDSSSWIFPALFGLSLLTLAVLVIGGLMLWGKKQDDINHMMSFCIKFLIDTRDEAERCKAAKALGSAKDPGALLVLIDVINDEKAEESVREAALSALREMGRRYRKYAKVIDDLIAAVQEKNHQKVIDILTSNFEGDGKKYVQTPYVIGRALMRLGNLSDAREWLRVANYRNKKTPTYVNQIVELADVCNDHLFAEADRLFNAGSYHDAKAHYAVASHGLGEEDKKRFAAYLREACVYCKLNDYEDADQALLQALQHHHETDMTLTLNKSLQRLLDQNDGAARSEQDLEKLDTEIDECVSDIMNKLAPSEK